MNRSLSIRSRGGPVSSDKAAPKHRLTMASLRGLQQPDLSKKLFRLIKSENHAVSAHEAAHRERVAIAQQLSEWGESTNDDAVSEISDKLAVLMAEIAEQEEIFAQNLEDSRGLLKQIRNTERSAQPIREQNAKILDELQRLKIKDPASPKIVQLEQEIVRAEAQRLVAEAQLTNVTRQKFKEAYDVHFAAVIERAEKQALLAKHARKVLQMLDDTPITPGNPRPAFDQVKVLDQILDGAETELRAWRPTYEPIKSQAERIGFGALPDMQSQGATTTRQPVVQQTAAQQPLTQALLPADEGTHTTESRFGSEGSTITPSEAMPLYVSKPEISSARNEYPQ